MPALTWEYVDALTRTLPSDLAAEVADVSVEVRAGQRVAVILEHEQCSPRHGVPGWQPAF